MIFEKEDMKTIILTVLCGLIMAGAAFGQQRKLVGNIKHETGGGCADFYHFAGQSTDSSKEMFYMSAGDENETWMNIDGQDVRLKFVSRTKPTKPDDSGGQLVGSRTTEKYIARNIRVEIIFTVSQLCAVDQPNCESVGSRAIFKVRKGARRQTVRAEGMFGC